MCPTYVIPRFAAVFVLASLALGTWVNPLWYLFAAFVALNLLQSTFSGWCLLERILGRLGVCGCTPRSRAA